MAWEVDRFGVKNNGLFAKWGYQRVMVDENGVIYADNVPGERSFNLNLNDYPNVKRSFSPGQLITEYCNFDTHTHYYIYAQNARPFAYVEGNINRPECGYQEPLPEPAVPPNPFGNPTYGVYRTFSYCDVDGQAVNVTIECKNYDGAVFPIEVGDKSPVRLSYKEVENKFTAIRPLECSLSFVVNENFLLEQFYSSDERTFRVTVEKSDIIRFRGYIIPDSCNEPFNAPPYPVTIRATDAIGGLKTVTYPIPVGSTADITQSFVDILAYCLAMTNLNLDISTICNLYDPKMANGLNDDPLSQALINPLRLSEDSGVTMNVYDVLAAIATAWGGYIAQIDGVWHLVRLNELSNEVIRRRTYNYKGLFLYGDNIFNKRVVGGLI